MHLATLCNGSTTDSGSVCQGSNPCVAAIAPQIFCGAFLLPKALCIPDISDIAKYPRGFCAGRGDILIITYLLM